MNTENFNQWEGTIWDARGARCLHSWCGHLCSDTMKHIWRPLSWHVHDTGTKKDRQRGLGASCMLFTTMAAPAYLFILQHWQTYHSYVYAHSYIIIHSYSIISRIRGKNRDTNTDRSSLRFVCLVFTAPNNRRKMEYCMLLNTLNDDLSVVIFWLKNPNPLHNYNATMVFL